MIEKKDMVTVQTIDKKQIPAHLARRPKKRQIFEEIRALKRQLLPDEKVILFGSQARGDAREDSDWDLLLLLNKPETTLEDEKLYAYPFTKLGWNYGAYFSVKLYTENDWEKRSFTPFYKNIETEGIKID
ncbi:hypothetical protein AGMMS50239_36380 [Bacteroidia bacterium]|nr:hypothetical protein AGMMS50239_36380 [Bacteroidia bacterium]